LGLSGCNKEPDQEAYLSPVARVAESARDEADSRINKALTLLKGEVASLSQIDRLLKSAPQDGEKKPSIDWSDTPFVAVAVVKADGSSPAVFPRGAAAFTEMLVEVADGPDLGDLRIIPNTFSFTLGLRHVPAESSGARLSALVDVDRVLVSGVLKPAAAAVGGYAFLANRDDRVILSTLPMLMGQALSKYGLPVAVAGGNAVAQVTVGKADYYVGTAKSMTANSWTLGVLVPVAAAQEEASED